MMQQTAPTNQSVQPAANDWVETLVQRVAGMVLHQLRQDRAAIEARAEAPMMTVAEAAAFLRCKPQRVYDLLSAATLTRYKDGVKVLIRRDELEMYVTTIEHTRNGAMRATGRR